MFERVRSTLSRSHPWSYSARLRAILDARRLHWFSRCTDQLGLSAGESHISGATLGVPEEHGRTIRRFTTPDRWSIRWWEHGVQIWDHEAANSISARTLRGLHRKVAAHVKGSR